MTLDDILELMKTMERSQKNLKHELYKMCWYMRGSVTAEEAFSMSVEDREIIGKIIHENLETTQKTKMPFF